MRHTAQREPRRSARHSRRDAQTKTITAHTVTDVALDCKQWCDIVVLAFALNAISGLFGREKIEIFKLYIVKLETETPRKEGGDVR